MKSLRKHLKWSANASSLSVALVLAIAVYIWFLPWSIWYQDPLLPAWVQAIGSISAILGTGLFVFLQHYLQVQQEKKRDHEADIESAKLLVRIIGRAHHEITRYQRQFLDKLRGVDNQHLLVNLSFANDAHIGGPTRKDFDFLLRSADPTLARDAFSFAAEISECVDLLNQYTVFYFERFTPEFAKYDKGAGGRPNVSQLAEVISPDVNAQAKLLVAAQFQTLYKTVEHLSSSRDDFLRRIGEAFPGSDDEVNWPSLGEQMWDKFKVNNDLVKVHAIYHANHGLIRWEIKLSNDPKEWLWKNQSQMPRGRDAKEFMADKINEMINFIFPQSSGFVISQDDR